MSIPRIVIAGTNSGCGKTTASMGIMAALSARGLKVQPFKVGPDYIDPMFHTFITGKASRNLDSWMLDEGTVVKLFSRNSSEADIAVIEGVMGMYDGLGGYSDEGSTAHVARIIEAPVILVVNGEGMSLSIVPLIKGFMDFGKLSNIRGVIINNINSEAHFQFLKKIILEHLDIAVIGYMKTMPEIALKSRHLGLVPEGEVEGLKKKIDILSGEVEKTLDLQLLYEIAGEKAVKEKSRGDGNQSDAPIAVGAFPQGARIAVARDKAFNFYYEDNLDLLVMLGAEVVNFSPLKDKHLPEGINGLYIGGGYPEVFAAGLEENKGMRESIKNAVISGLPTYAECGGLMYLSEGIINGKGEKFDMVGIVPGMSKMTRTLQRFGYVEIDISQDNVLIEKGEKIRGHEFHYSVTEVKGDIPACYNISHGIDSKAEVWQCGFKFYNLLAGYPHLHFWSNPSFAKGFVKNCLKYDKQLRDINASS